MINLLYLILIQKKETIVEKAEKSVPYYPLPSNEGYEKFLQSMKKEQCIYF
jgi:hypothetical protein